MVSEYPRRGLEILSQIHGEKCWPLVNQVSPCEEACPLHMDVPSYVMAIAQGKFKEALEVIRESTPFPSVCGRVCHHPCEEACNRIHIDRPVAIEWLKRFAADYALRGPWEAPARAQRTRPEKVAVIGSGPAGLTAAYDLVKQGFGATVYEAAPVAGGMMALGIPEFVLPKEVLEAEIGHIKASGVEIKTGIQVGKDITIDHLRRHGYQAILLASGALKGVPLNIPGADLSGVIYPLPLLEDLKLGRKVALRGKVVVIGGGNVAIDAARAAVRLGAQEVHLACLESRKEMPAFPWETENAEKEGVRLHPSLAPQKMRSRDGRRVVGVDFKRVASTSVDSQGRVSWTLMEGPGTDYAMEADTVIIAIGQVPDLSYAADSLGLNLGPRGNLVVDVVTLATNVPGIFAAGDSVRVAGTVTDSIAAGHRVAESIGRYLRGEDLRAGRDGAAFQVFKIEKETPIPGFLVRKNRWGMPALAPENRPRSFQEVFLGYTPGEAIEEAKRCLNCRMCGNCLFERGQLCFETSTRLL